MTASTIDAVTYQAVADVLIRYATGIDNRNWSLFETCFTDDCDVDYGDIGVWNGAHEIRAFMQEMHEPCGHTMHSISNITVHSTETGATARSYVNGIIMFGDNSAGVRAAGYYDDELTPANGGCKIARRRFTPVLMQMVTNDTARSSNT